jgi:hypothetical protein
MMLIGRDLVRTVIPLTTPNDLVTRNPGSSKVVVVCMAATFSVLDFGRRSATDGLVVIRLVKYMPGGTGLFEATANARWA